MDTLKRGFFNKDFEVFKGEFYNLIYFFNSKSYILRVNELKKARRMVYYSFGEMYISQTLNIKDEKFNLIKNYPDIYDELIKEVSEKVKVFYNFKLNFLDQITITNSNEILIPIYPLEELECNYSEKDSTVLVENNLNAYSSLRSDPYYFTAIEIIDYDQSNDSVLNISKSAYNFLDGLVIKVEYLDEFTKDVIHTMRIANTCFLNDIKYISSELKFGDFIYSNDLIGAFRKNYSSILRGFYYLDKSGKPKNNY